MSARDVITDVIEKLDVYGLPDNTCAGGADAILAALSAAPLPDRLALARALVPEYVVAKVPTKADQWDSPGYDHGTPPGIIWADGYNAAISDTLTAALATPPEDAR